MRRRMTTEEFKKRVQEAVGDEYVVLGEYISSSSKILMRHTTCGHEWSPIANGFINIGTRCPKCAVRSRSYTQEEFENLLFEIVGDEYKAVGKYVSQETHIDMLHVKCGHVWKVKPGFFMNRGTRCPKCSHGAPVSGEEFAKRVSSINGDILRVVGNYKGYKHKVDIEMIKCGHVLSVTASSLLQRRSGWCRTCSKLKKKDKENAILQRNEELNRINEEASKELSDEFLMVNSDAFVRTFEHKKCGKRFKRDVRVFIKHQTCPKCSERTSDTDSFKRKVKELTGDEFKVTGEYTKSNAPIEMFHQKGCEEYFSKTPSSFLSFPGCPLCGNKKSTRKTTREFKEEVRERFKGSYKVIGEYKTREDLVKVKHKCGHIYDILPDTLLRKHPLSGCPSCAESLSVGEKMIRKELNKLRVSFSQQYTFNDCKNKNVLRFDFAIFDSQGNIAKLIEYDGEQHYRPIEFFGGAESFKYRRENDKIKNKFCQDNKIDLVRIPYWDLEKIPEILKEELKGLYFKSLKEIFEKLNIA